MFNRLIRWMYRRIEGAPSTPLDVLGKPPVNSGPWSIERLGAMRGGFGHDSVQLAADGEPVVKFYIGDDLRWH